MASLDQQMTETQKQIVLTQQKMAEVTSQLDRAGTETGVAEPGIDIANATLADVNAHTETMNANIAELIMGLDDVTAGFSKDFEEMRSKTGWESFVGIFARGKAESMRQERLRTASIDDKLQDLISKSDVITRLLQDQLAQLNDQKAKVETNLTGTLSEREARGRHAGGSASEDRCDGPEADRAGKQGRLDHHRPLRPDPAGNRTRQCQQGS